MDGDFLAIDLGGDLAGGLFLVVPAAGGQEQDEYECRDLDQGTLHWTMHGNLGNLASGAAKRKGPGTMARQDCGRVLKEQGVTLRARPPNLWLQARPTETAGAANRRDTPNKRASSTFREIQKT